jgi:hypothetical protein
VSFVVNIFVLMHAAGLDPKESLNKSGRAAMRIKIVKCEARNAVNIGNIDKFRNEAVGDSKLMDAGHDLFRGSLNIRFKPKFMHFDT